MAAQKTERSVEKKRRSKKRKSRTEVASSSESENESRVEKRKRRKERDADMNDENQAHTTSSQSPPAAKKKKSKRSTTTASPPILDQEAVPTPEVAPEAPSTNPAPAQQADAFTTAYLRKITTELADDLDKVREAPDFKASSVAMLVHVLKQGGELFSVNERRRFCGLTS